MKQKLIKVISFLLSLALFNQIIFAEDDYGNADGGGGGMGKGTSSDIWAVTSNNGGIIYDAEGFRVYLVNSSTGAPISASVDITNSNVAKTNVYNGQGKTKYDYNYDDSTLSVTSFYDYVKVDTTPNKLPQIIPWNEGNSEARIDAIKDWFLTGNYADWVLAQLGSDIDEVRAGGYLLAVEPIAYFRYNDLDYAMTATEVALYDKMKGGDVRNKLGPLTHKNLPLSVFLEDSEFIGNPAQIDPWTGSRTATVTDDNIINYLGIGFIHYVEQEKTTGEALFSYPTDTWVVTPFRLCNLIPAAGSWANGKNITSKNPASAVITVKGTPYNISNIYIPSGSEQLVWMKWKTPSTPQELPIIATATKGLFYNEQNTGVSDRYVNIVNATVKIYDNEMEKVPPDPTLNDTPSSIGYTESGVNGGKNTLLSSSNSTNSWYVWDCWFELEKVYTKTYTATDRQPSYPTGNDYNEVTGIYTEREVVDTSSRSYRVQVSSDPVRYVSHTDYSVTVEFKEYKYRYGKISYTAEVKNSYVTIKPDAHCPTAYTKFYETYMKSGYGINVELETYIKVTVRHERLGTTTSDIYYSPSTTSYAACPQYMFGYFPEFNYGTYYRQLEKDGGKYKFRKNRYSTYNDRTHYTPWWFPDNGKYSIVSRSDFAYTPAGKLDVYAESNYIVIEGNLYDDWRQVPIR